MTKEDYPNENWGGKSQKGGKKVEKKQKQRMTKEDDSVETQERCKGKGSSKTERF